MNRNLFCVENAKTFAGYVCSAEAEKEGLSIQPSFRDKAYEEKKKKILIVDDNTDLLALNRTILELENYEVLSAPSGASALAILAGISASSEYPNLILLDMRMEEMSGSEFLFQLERSYPEMVREVPVVFLTGVEVVPATKAAGVIRKPIGIDEFIAGVKGYIEKTPGRTPVQH